MHPHHWSTAVRITFALTSLLAASVAAAEEAEPPAEPIRESIASDFTLDFEVAYTSKYIWRGLPLTDGDSVQPSATIGYKGLSFNFWGNVDVTTASDKRGYMTEQDYTLDYSTSWKKLNFSVGALYYKFPHTHFHDTLELYGGVGLDVLLQPTVTVYRDVDETDGSYTVGSLSHSFALPKFSETVSASLDLEGTLGFGSSLNNKAYFGVRRRAFTDVGLFASLPISIGEHVTVTPSFTYTSILDHRLRRNNDHDGNMAVAIALGYSF